MISHQEFTLIPAISQFYIGSQKSDPYDLFGVWNPGLQAKQHILFVD